jgi:hypothetical protein
MSGSRPIRTPAGMINVEPVNAPARRGAVVRVANVDTWTVMRTGFVLSLSIAVVLVVAVLALWGLFSAAGVFSAVGGTADDIVGANSSGTASNIEQWFSFPRVAGVTLVLAVVEVVLVTAAMTLFASLYNIAAGWVGGVEVTLSEHR